MRLPPVAEILLAEKALRSVSTREELVAELNRGLAQELKVQAEWTEKHFQYDATPTADHTFVTSAAGVLNPFSELAKCTRHIECIQREADKFLQTVAVYSDKVVLPDRLTHSLAYHPVDPGWASDLFQYVKVLHYMEPFIRQGVIGFGSSFPDDLLHGTNEHELDNIAAELARLSESDTNVRLHKHGNDSYLEVICPLLSPDSDVPVKFEVRLPENEAAVLAERLPYNQWTAAADSEALRRDIFDRVQYATYLTFDELTFARRANAVLLGSTRVEMAFLSRLQQQNLSTREMAHIEAAASIRLPWLERLTPDQLLKVRAEAQYALPRLRSRLLAAAGDHVQSESALAHVVAELRAEVAEVEREIDAIRRRHATWYHVAEDALAVAFVLYGLASGVPAIAASSIAAFLATQAHLQSVTSEREAELSKLESRAAYALVTAKRIARGMPRSPLNDDGGRIDSRRSSEHPATQSRRHDQELVGSAAVQPHL